MLLPDQHIMPELNQCFDIFNCLNQVFSVPASFFGEWYGGKILEKNPGISLTKTHWSSHSMSDLVSGAPRSPVYRHFFIFWSFLLHFRSRYWRMARRRNSEKNSNCSFRWDLSFELLYVEIRFLRLSKSCVWRRIFQCLNRVFLTLNVISGERYGWKILNENFKSSPRWDLSIAVLDVEFRALRTHKSRAFNFFFF